MLGLIILLSFLAVFHEMMRSLTTYRERLQTAEKAMVVDLYLRKQLRNVGSVQPGKSVSGEEYLRVDFDRKSQGSALIISTRSGLKCLSSNAQNPEPVRKHVSYVKTEQGYALWCKQTGADPMTVEVENQLAFLQFWLMYDTDGNGSIDFVDDGAAEHSTTQNHGLVQVAYAFSFMSPISLSAGRVLARDLARVTHNIGHFKLRKAVKGPIFFSSVWMGDYK